MFLPMQERLRIAILTKAAALTFIDGNFVPISNKIKEKKCLLNLDQHIFMIHTLVTNQNSLVL